MLEPGVKSSQPSQTSKFPRRSSEVLILLLTIAAIYAMICAPILSGKVYAEYDLREQFIPWRVFYSLALDKNELGMWNPFMFRGYDHHAEGQSGVMHPAHLLAYKFLPLSISIPLEMFCYIPFAFIGMMTFLARSLGLPRTAAVFGGGVFSLSVFFYAHFPHVNMLWIYAHLPWAAFAVERCFRSANCGRYASLLSLIYASMLLLGHPQMVWMNTLAIIVVVLHISTESRRHSNPRCGLILTGAGIFGGCLIGMIQLLPSLEYFLHSSRIDFTKLMSSNFSLHPLNLILNLSPYLFIDKSVGDLFYESAGNAYFLNSHQELPAYLGVTIMTTIYIGTVIYRKEVFTATNKTRLILFLSALALSMLLALGKYGGVNHVLDVIPMISKFRCPARYICIVIFLISVASAIVVSLFETHKPPTRLDRIHWVLLSAPVVASVTLWIGSAFCRSISFRNTMLYIEDARYLAIGPVFMLVAYICCFLIRSGKKWALTVLCVACIVDVAVYALPILQRSELRTLDQIKTSKLKMKNNDHTYRHVSKLNEPLWNGSFLANGYLGIPPRDDLDLFENRDHLRLASVRYAHGTTNTFVIEDAFPRIRLVPNLRHAVNPLNDLKNIDLSNTVLCDKNDASEITGPPIKSTERVELVADGFEALRLDVKVDVPRILVVSDRWSKDWDVSIDGVEQGIIPLFGRHMRGIIVGTSDKEVLMRYRPVAIRWGVACAGLGLIISFILFFQDGAITRRIQSDSQCTST